MDRLQLQSLFESITPNVYFQPPESIVMKYPCIVYNLDREATRFANNVPYTIRKGYATTVIDANPDSDIPDKISKLPMCLFNRFFVAGNLNHFVYTLFT